MEQEMEIEALQAILMDDIKELEPEEGLGGETPTYHITIAPKDEDEDEPTEIPVRLGLVFRHTLGYPDEPPVFKVRSIRGVRDVDLLKIQTRLENEVQENLGMSMMFSLAQSAKELLRAIVCGTDDNMEEEAAQKLSKKEEAELAHKRALREQGTPVTAESWNAWFDRFSAEIALEKAKMATNIEISKKNRMSGKAYFENKYLNQEGGDEDELEEDFDFGEELDDDDDLLDEFLEQNDQGALAAGQQAVGQDS